MIAEKLGDRYQLLSGYDTTRIIKDILEKKNQPLTNEQYMALRESFGDSGIRGNLDMPFIAYRWDEEKPANSWYWRFTLPILYIYAFILFFAILPIKWLFTGKYHLTHESKLRQLHINWYNKIMDRKWSE